MSAIRGKNSRPEMAIRQALHVAGFRYRLHERKLPGNPDIVLPKHKAVVFVHGCFWHKHTCSAFKMPANRQDFWRAKIEGNVARDELAVGKLLNDGWRVAIVWECALRGRNRVGISAAVGALAGWLRDSSSPTIEIGEAVPSN
jgi:DNA mismatch endonuclease, patch repair protein